MGTAEATENEGGKRRTRRLVEEGAQDLAQGGALQHSALLVHAIHQAIHGQIQLMSFGRECGR